MPDARKPKGSWPGAAAAWEARRASASSRHVPKTAPTAPGQLSQLLERESRRLERPQAPHGVCIRRQVPRVASGCGVDDRAHSSLPTGLCAGPGRLRPVRSARRFHQRLGSGRALEARRRTQLGCSTGSSPASSHFETIVTSLVSRALLLPLSSITVP